MRLSRSGSAILLAGLLLSLPALAQRIAPQPVEPVSRPSVSGVAGSAPPVSLGTSLPPVSLTPTLTLPPTPALILAAPAPAAAIAAPAAAAPPPACYPRSESDCAYEASQCLAREYVSSNYEVAWDDQGPYVSRIYYSSDDAEARATGCATDLYRCLQPAC